MEEKIIRRKKLLLSDLIPSYVSVKETIENAPFAQRFAVNGNRKIKVGDFVFADGNSSKDPHYRNVITGVVVWINPDPQAPVGKRILIMTPDQKELKWAEKDYFFDCTDFNDGFGNTYKLLDAAKKQNIILPAAQYCADYCQNGVQAGEGFMAARNQLEAISSNDPHFEDSFVKIGAPDFDEWYWSSSEFDRDDAWFLDASCYHTYDRGNKDNRYFYVRCVLAG